MKFIFILLCIAIVNVSGVAQVTWNTASTVGASSSGNSHPRIALDRSGNPLMLWGHSGRVMFSRWDGMKFTAPQMINQPAITTASASWMGPDIAAHGDTVYVVMKQTPEASDTCRLWCAHSYDGGKTFSAPVKVDTTPGIITRFPAVTADADGNPIIAFMKFDASFGGARWSVLRSTDLGRTFSLDTKASGWSSPKSEVCNCCPGTIVCSHDTVAVVYRDNNSNLRDSWVGVSTDHGASFTSGWNVDNNNWTVDACPASGPSAVIAGDSLYAVFMNAASGKSLVYRSVSALSGAGTARTTALTGNFSGLTDQNYPRIARSGSAAAIVWTQNVNGTDQLSLLFTSDITKGFPQQNQIVASGNVVNADVALVNGTAYVIWEDDNTGIIRFRTGTYPTTPSAVAEPAAVITALAFPNPILDGPVQIRVPDPSATTARVVVSNIMGQHVYTGDLPVSNGSLQISLRDVPAGMYIVTMTAGAQIFTTRIVRQ